MPRIDSLDHLVLTVMHISATVAFYRDVLGMQVETFQVADGTVRTAMMFGQQKINLHPAQTPFDPRADVPMPGSADLCFLSAAPLADWVSHLANLGIEIEQGPIARTGATGPIMSLYLRDPDGNLIEISNRV